MKAEWKGYTIESENVGRKSANWDPYSSDRHHVITILNGKSKISFDYWTSRMSPTIENERDLLTAVECFFSDASAGYGDFYDFCNEMGYDVPKGAYESWKACRGANSQAEYLFGNDWVDIADELREEMWG